MNYQIFCTKPRSTDEVHFKRLNFVFEPFFARNSFFLANPYPYIAFWLDCFNINVCLRSGFFHVRTGILDNKTTFIPFKTVGIYECLRT